MENVDETKLQGDHLAEPGMESAIGEKLAEESVEEPASPEIIPEEFGKDDLVDADTALKALIDEVGRAVDRVESRLTAKEQMAGIMLALATTILAILSGVGMHGTTQYLAATMEASAILLGIAVMVLILLASSVSGISEAMAEFDRGNYGLMMESIINNGTTLMDNSTTRDRVATIILLLQVFTGSAGFVMLAVGSI